VPLSLLLLLLLGVLLASPSGGTDATETGALAAGSAALLLLPALLALPALAVKELSSLPKSGSLIFGAAGLLLLGTALLLLWLEVSPSTALFTSAVALFAFAARDPSNCPRSGSLICTDSPLELCPCVKMLGSWIVGISGILKMLVKLGNSSVVFVAFSASDRLTFGST
jgi:hypothetical protein